MYNCSVAVLLHVLSVCRVRQVLKSYAYNCNIGSRSSKQNYAELKGGGEGGGGYFRGVSFDILFQMLL